MTKPVPHQTPYGERITLELAKEIAAAGEAFATKQGWNATIGRPHPRAIASWYATGMAGSRGVPW